MVTQAEDKLSEYLSQIKGLEARGDFPIGAVLVAEGDRRRVLDSARREGYRLIDADDFHPDIVLRDLFDAVKKKESIVINITLPLRPKLLSHLNNLAYNIVDVWLAGEKERTVFTPGEYDAKVVLVMTPELYDTTIWQDTIFSVCHL